MNIADRIKHRRLELGLTLDEVAKKLNVNVSTVSRYETCEIENMGIDKIEKLSKALSCSPDYLMGWDRTKFEDEGTLLYNKLDKEDRAEIRGAMKQMLKSSKYNKVKQGLIDEILNALPSDGKAVAYGGKVKKTSISSQQQKKINEIMKNLE